MHEYIIRAAGKGAVLTADDGGRVPLGRNFRPGYEGWTINVNQTSAIIVASFQFLNEFLLVTKFAEVGPTGEFIPGGQAYEELRVAMSMVGATYPYSRKNFNMIIQLSDL